MPNRYIKRWVDMHRVKTYVFEMALVLGWKRWMCVVESGLLGSGY